jgi:hypothetical protein
MRSGSRSGDRVVDGLEANKTVEGISVVQGKFLLEIVRDGEVIEEFETPNLVVNEGLNYQASVALLGGTGVDPWYVAPVDGSPTIAAGDTYASHAGWDEVEDYDEATRPEWEGASGATGVVTNSANRAEFTISEGGATIGGVALVGGGTDANTKGDTAGGGTLFSASAFSGGNRVLQESDVLRVTWQHTHSNA